MGDVELKVLSLNHYNLRAPRELLDRLRAFYVEVVGLEVGYRPPFMTYGYWLYAGDEAVLHLSEGSGGATSAVDAPTNFDHAAFNCSGRREFETKLARVSIKYDVACVPQTRQIQLFLKDPAGNGVELNFTDADS